MKFSNQGEQILMDMEGFIEKPTPDLGGHPTIGYGHKIKPGEKFNTITKGTGILILQDDVKPLEDVLNGYIPIKLTQNQFDALIVFMFNIGQTAFLNSTVFSDIKLGHFETATIPWERWINISKYETDPKTGEKKRKLVPVKGLINRRKREIELFRRK
jgi:GH24 family phage-related lysozyme (muramidase)